jgi:hypothetical protein
MSGTRMAQRDMTRNACDSWADGNYCCGAITRRYMNGWRCMKHTPATIRKALNLTNERTPA